MRFKTFLEAQVTPYNSEPKELSELAALIKKHCSQAIEGQRIYRGSKQKLKNGIFDPGSGTRKSQNTSNYYTVFLDSNPKNEAFPKRAKSFIATTHERTALNYGSSGSVMVLFPFDGTKIGVINEHDLWDLQIDLGEPFDLDDEPTLRGMNPNIKIILETISHEYDYEIPTLAEFIALVEKTDVPDVIEAFRECNLIDEDWRDETLDKQEKVVKKFLAVLPKIYSYKNLGCTVVPIGRLDTEHSEVWFSGKCIAVTLDDYDKIKEEVEA